MLGSCFIRKRLARRPLIESGVVHKSSNQAVIMELHDTHHQQCNKLSDLQSFTASYPNTIHHTHASIHCGPSAPSRAQPASVPSIKSCFTAQSSNSWLLPVFTRNAPITKHQLIRERDSEIEKKTLWIKFNSYQVLYAVNTPRWWFELYH